MRLLDSDKMNTHYYLDYQGYQLDLQQRRIYYQDLGQGETVLILHGNGADAQFYRPLVEALAPDYRVLVPDLPGYGRTPARTPLSPESYLEEIERFIRHYVREPFYLIGHSLGAFIAYQLQLRRKIPPLKKVIWMEAAIFEFPKRIQFILPWYGLWHGLKPHFRQEVEARISDWCWDNYNESPLTRERFIRSYFRSDPWVQGMFYAQAAELLPYRFAELSEPMLCLRGQKETFISRSTDWIVPQLPQARKQVIPQAGHFMIDENNQALAEAVRDFFARPAEAP